MVSSVCYSVIDWLPDKVCDKSLSPSGLAETGSGRQLTAGDGHRLQGTDSSIPHELSSWEITTNNKAYLTLSTLGWSPSHELFRPLLHTT